MAITPGTAQGMPVKSDGTPTNDVGGSLPGGIATILPVKSDGTPVVDVGNLVGWNAAQRVLLLDSAGNPLIADGGGAVSPSIRRMVAVNSSMVPLTDVGGSAPGAGVVLLVKSDGTPIETLGDAGLGGTLTLTMSGNEITDAVRLANVQGDGLSPEGSVGVWRDTTNRVSNGGFESNTTGWNAVSSTLSRVTSQYKFGAASGQVVTSNATANEGAYHDFTATAAVYSVSAWVRGDAGGTVRMAVRDSGGGSPQTGTAVTLTTSWQRITLTTTALTAATWRCYIETNVQQSITFQVDGVQAETLVLPTPYVETNGSTASRPASVISFSAGSVIDETQSWAAVRMRLAAVSTGQSKRPLWWGPDSNNRVSIVVDSASTNVYVQRRSGGAGVDSSRAVSLAGTTCTVIGAWTASSILNSVNGSTFGSAANSSIPVLDSDLVQFSPSGVFSGDKVNGEILWIAIGTGTLTDADAANIHASGDTDPSSGLFPPAANLTMIWKAIDSTAYLY